MLRLLELLRRIDAKLGEIWIDCKNNEVCERIAHERDLLTNIIEAISLLHEDD
jgi:hypothetical protein